MGVARRLDGKFAMASPWRYRRMCILVSEQRVAATLRHISAKGAFLETNERPAIGAHVELHHPDAGIAAGTVRSLEQDGIGIAFDCCERSVAFALAAITADMSRPAS